MESSEQQQQQQAQQEQEQEQREQEGVQDPAAEHAAAQPPQEQGGGPVRQMQVTEGESDAPIAAAGESVPPGEDIPGADADRNPAVEQAPIASEAQERVIGEPGLRDEQSPLGSAGGVSMDMPVRTSAPPPGFQSGTPLAADRETPAEAAQAPEGAPEGEGRVNE